MFDYIPVCICKGEGEMEEGEMEEGEMEAGSLTQTVPPTPSGERESGNKVPNSYL